MSNADERVIKNTSELVLGDVVHVHGMDVRLDQEPKTWTDTYGTGLQVWSYRGTVVDPNAESIGTLVPRSWLRHHDDPDDGQLRWNVQGNVRAEWCVTPAQQS